MLCESVSKATTAHHENVSRYTETNYKWQRLSHLNLARNAETRSSLHQVATPQKIKPYTPNPKLTLAHSSLPLPPQIPLPTSLFQPSPNPHFPLPLKPTLIPSIKLSSTLSFFSPCPSIPLYKPEISFVPGVPVVTVVPVFPIVLVVPSTFLSNLLSSSPQVGGEQPGVVGNR